MATRKSFQALASKLVNQTFGDFRRPLLLENAGVYDPITDTVTGGDTQSLKGIRLEYKQSEFQYKQTAFDAMNIKQGDFKIICVAQELLIEVRPDSTSAIFDGKEIHIVDVTSDPADAALIFQAREK